MLLFLSTYYHRLPHALTRFTIDTVCSEDATLLLDHFLLTEALLGEEAELGLHVPNLEHQILQPMELVAVRLTVEVVPDVLDFALRVLAEHLDQVLG